MEKMSTTLRVNPVNVTEHLVDVLLPSRSTPCDPVVATHVPEDLTRSTSIPTGGPLVSVVESHRVSSVDPYPLDLYFNMYVSGSYSLPGTVYVFNSVSTVHLGIQVRIFYIVRLLDVS